MRDDRKHTKAKGIIEGMSLFERCFFAGVSAMLIGLPISAYGSGLTILQPLQSDALDIVLMLIHAAIVAALLINVFDSMTQKRR